MEGLKMGKGRGKGWEIVKEVNGREMVKGRLSGKRGKG